MNTHKIPHSLISLAMLVFFLCILLPGCGGGSGDSSSSSSSPSTGTVTGKVTDSDGSPIQGAIVSIGDLFSTTRSDGTYTIKEVPASSGRN